MTINARPLSDAIYSLALEGDVHQLIGYVSENAFG
jgi:hypothetical protein